MKDFLNAEWRKLVIANYEVDKSILEKYVPYKTELDLWNNKCYVSLVGFMFLNTKLKGFKIPFHSNFEEVNLRFYVKNFENGVWRRGVVFIKEIVPKMALTFVANTIYNEHYQTLPMKHHWIENENDLSVEYAWKVDKKWNTIQIITEHQAQEIITESEEEFITEHYWGFTKINDNTTSEYGVEHPKWKVYQTKSFSIDVDFEKVYGADFKMLQQQNPNSVFLAEGSEIAVKSKKFI